MLGIIVNLIIKVIQLYEWVVIGSIIYSWLANFNVINTRSPAVSAIGEFLFRATEPVLEPIRRILPNLGPLDISPIILFLGLDWLLIPAIRYLYAMTF